MGPRSHRLDDLFVIDADFHLTEKVEDFVSYASGPFGKQLASAPDHHTHGLYPSPGLYNNISRGYNETRGVRSQTDVLDAMTEFSLDRVVLTPTRNLYLACVQHDEIAATLAAAYNEWILDKFLDPSLGIFGSILAVPQRPHLAAEQIDLHADESGFVSAFFPVGGISPLGGHATYHPLYEACVDNGLPLAMHAASGNMTWAFPHVNQMFNRMLPMHLVSHSLIHMTNLADLVTRGILVRYPELQLIVQEAGLGWIPYFLRRFDLEYYNNREDAPMLTRRPSEYLLDHCHFTSQPIEGSRDINYITHMIELFDGERTLMFSSDYPHFDFDNSDELLKCLTRFDDDVVADIYGRTASEVFGIQ